MEMREALKLFQEKLLKSKAAPYVLKIVLFGSFAKGKATRESDLDVLVLSSNGQAVHDEIAKIAFSLQMDYQVPIEPIVENVDEILHPSYFLFNVLSYGKEVYSVEKEKIKQEAEANLREEDAKGVLNLARAIIDKASH